MTAEKEKPSKLRARAALPVGAILTAMIALGRFVPLLQEIVVPVVLFTIVGIGFVGVAISLCDRPDAAKWSHFGALLGTLAFATAFAGIVFAMFAPSYFNYSRSLVCGPGAENMRVETLVQQTGPGETFVIPIVSCFGDAGEYEVAALLVLLLSAAVYVLLAGVLLAIAKLLDRFFVPGGSSKAQYATTLVLSLLIVGAPYVWPSLLSPVGQPIFRLLLVFDDEAPYHELLIEASKDGDAELVQKLVEGGAEPNIRGRRRTSTTAVGAASEAGNVEVLKILLANGGDPDAETISGVEPPLVVAIRGGTPDHLEVVNVLVEAGADVLYRYTYPRWTPIRVAADADDPRFLAIVMAEAARRSPNVAKVWSKGIAFELGGLMDVVSRGDLELASAFLDEDYPAESRSHLIGLAANYGHPDIVALLLSRGADPNAIEKGETPSLALVASRKEPQYVQIATILLDAGADISAREGSNSKARTPVSAAEEDGSPEMLKLLAEAVAMQSPVAAKLWQQGIPFTRRQFANAARSGDLNSLRLFLEGGMDGRDFLRGAARAGRIDLARLYLEFADPKTFVGVRGTPLHDAVQTRDDKAPDWNLAMVRLLIDAGFDPNVKKDRFYAVLAYVDQEEDPQTWKLVEEVALARRINP